MTHLPDILTNGEKYDYAMLITEVAEADAYFEACVEHHLRLQAYAGKTPNRAEAERIERANLGYWAGYYDPETRARVERLFRCVHPIFGAIAEVGAPTPEEAFRKGVELGKQRKAECDIQEAQP